MNEKVITATDWDESDFYFDNLNGKWVDARLIDVSTDENFDCTEEDLFFAESRNDIGLRNVRIVYIED